MNGELIRVAIVGAADADPYRTVASSVLGHFQSVLFDDLGYPIALHAWDYKSDTPRLVPKGRLAARSVQMVQNSETMIAVFEEDVGPVTKDEVREMVERRRDGEPVEVMVFLNPGKKGEELDGFFESLARECDWEPSWTPYTDELEFQALVFKALLKFIIPRLGTFQTPPLLPEAPA